MAIVFTRAFLYGVMEREVYIELPDEDARKHIATWWGLLRKSMYGLRDAPFICQKVMRKMLGELGFVALKTAQCVYANPTTAVVIVAHVDDFLCFGDAVPLAKLLE